MTISSHPVEIIEQLKSIVGKNNYIDDASKMDSFLNDWRGKFQGKSPLILKPLNSQMVSEILTLCNKSHIGVVPQGGNTGLVGGSVPSKSGLEVVISLERMNKIIDIDPINYTITLEAGCILSEVQNAAKDVGRMFPLSLAAEGSCQIGGNLSTNAGGTAVLRYGNAKELALGLEVVLPDGTIMNGLRRLRKDNTGYDLKQLFLGAEGTLGIITKVVLKLFPLHADKVTSLVAMSDLASTTKLLAKLREFSGDNITAFEYMDRACIETLIEQTDLEDFFSQKYQHYALVELSSSRQDAKLKSLLESALESAFVDDIAIDAVIASSETQAAQIWRLREELSEVLRRLGAFITFDVSIPVSLVPEFITKATRFCNEYCELGRVFAFGHIGDGNIHFYLFEPKDGDTDNFLAQKSEIKTNINDITAKLHGSFSAEHGVGLAKKQELKQYKSSVELKLMREIKKTIDPNNIMNPGKVL
jgi:FAD/FMN-containing dehydrogenase